MGTLRSAVELGLQPDYSGKVRDVFDLGDLKTVMNGGVGVGTMGFYEASKDSNIKSTIIDNRSF